MENHRCHDDRALVARWRRIARASGLQLTAFAESGGHPVYALQTRARSPGGLYVSAGIHGDEPAGPEDPRPRIDGRRFDAERVDLARRVQAQVLLVEESLRHLLATPRGPFA